VTVTKHFTRNATETTAQRQE